MNVVDFDDKYIVSASGDRTIKVKTFALKYLLSNLFFVRCGQLAPVNL